MFDGFIVLLLLLELLLLKVLAFDDDNKLDYFIIIMLLEFDGVLATIEVNIFGADMLIMLVFELLMPLILLRLLLLLLFPPQVFKELIDLDCFFLTPPVTPTPIPTLL